MGRTCSTYWGRAEVYEGFWWRNLEERDKLEAPGDRWEANIEIDLQEVG
jgi:hypothetical protein